MNFSTKPRHVTPQIDCLGETSTVLRVSTHIYGVSKDIGGKTFIWSFVCNTKRPSVKQSIKWQVSSNFQIYLSKTDEPPQYQT